MSIDFSNMDNLVKDAIRQFLPVEALGTSAVTSKLFQSMMNDKGTWMKMAKKLSITPASADSAKSEVITRLMENAVLAKHAFSTESEIKTCKDPFKLNGLIKSTLQDWRFNYGLFLQAKSLIQEYNKTVEKKEKPDETKLDAALLLLKKGTMSLIDQEDCKSVLNMVKGYIKVGEKQYIYPPRHLGIFQTIVDGITESTRLSSFEKKSLIDNYSIEIIALDQSGDTIAFDEKGNYPYNFFQVAINAGWHPSVLTILGTYFDCPLSFSGKAEETPIAQRIKFVRLLLKNSTSEEKQQVLASYKPSKIMGLPNSSLEYIFEQVEQQIHMSLKSLLNCLLYPMLSDGIPSCFKLDLKQAQDVIYQYIHWPETKALILEQPIEPSLLKDQAERRQKVLSVIEREEKVAFENLKNILGEKSENAKYIKEFASRLKQAANF